jgi:AcrR family transcriptional regulator
MAEAGTAAISLRAIAREMGVTAAALYSYYETRDALVTALLLDAWADLAEVLEQARASQPETDLGAQVVAVGLAYRHWALNHPAEFRLVFGEPIPGYRAPEQGPTVDGARRVGAIFLDLVVAAWRLGRHRPTAGAATWDDFPASFAAWASQTFGADSAGPVAFHVRALGRLHGLVTLEVHQFLQALITHPDRLYRAELEALLDDLGLLPPAVSTRS